MKTLILLFLFIFPLNAIAQIHEYCRGIEYGITSDNSLNQNAINPVNTKDFYLQKSRNQKKNSKDFIWHWNDYDSSRDYRLRYELGY